MMGCEQPILRGRTNRRFIPVESFAEMFGMLRPGPIGRHLASPNRAVEGGIRPIRRVRHQLVSDRIEMNVIGMGTKIPIITDQVFPETTLPQAALPLGDP